MSVHEGHVAFGFTLATFHGYSFIVIYSLLAQSLDGSPAKTETDKEDDDDDDVDSGLNDDDPEKAQTSFIA